MEANHFKIYRLFRLILFVGIFLILAKTTWSQNYALSFDGSGDYVAFGNPAGLQIAGSQTLEMWVYPQSLNARRNPLAKAYAGEGTITLETDGTLSYFYGTGGANNSPYQGFSSVAKLTVDTWTHVALVRDLSAMKLYWYFNGVEVAEAPASYTYAQIGTLPFYIGRGYVSDFHGRIDEVRIWNVARTHSDIAAFYDESLTGSETGLAAYWPFDEGSGNTIYDKTSSGINGTRNGNAAFVTTAAPINPPAPGTEAFEPVPPTGLPYNIVLSNLTINGNELPVGAQVGVFDDELCVGSAFYTGNPNQNLVAWKADPEQNLAGFTAGNPMIFKIRSPWHSEVRVFDPELTMVKGNGNFGYGTFSVVNLAVSTSLLPAFSISAENLNFNTVIVNQSLTLPLVFENTGSAILSVNSLLNSSTNFVKSATAFLIYPGESATLNVTFTPTAVTTYSDLLTFVTDDPDLPSMSVPLYGTGLPQATPQITVTPSSLNFGGVAKNTTKTMTLNVLNPGNGTLNVTGITSSNPAFTVFGATTFSLGQGENRNISIVFAPTQAGVFNGQLTIANNAANQTIPMQGIASQGHFISVSPTGKPYSLVVEDVDIDGFRPLAGDEVAVFDGSLCVGTGIAGGNGNSLALNGSNAFVINDNSTAFDVSQLTISAWVYSSNFAQNGFIFEKGPVNSQYSLFFEGNNINFRTLPTSGGYNDFYVSLATAGIQNNQWNHVAATYDGAFKRLYVNGQLKATQASTGTLITGQAGQIIGAYSGTGSHSYFFNGNIDEVRVYNYARSVFEIESDMNHELRGTESGLVGYWNFNNGNFNNLVPGATPCSLAGGASLQGAQNPQIFSGLLITAWEKDEALGLPGFTPGNPMSFKVWTEVYDNWVEIAATPEYSVGNGNFGFGQMCVLTLEGTSGLAPDISVPIQSLYVGQVTVGSSVVNNVQVTNEGNAPLHITLSDNSAAFSTSIASATVLPGNTLTFQVTFSPSVPGGYSGMLTIQSNDPDEPQVTVALEGFALPAGAANIATSVNVLSFENVEVGTSETRSFFVINTGTTPLTVSNIAFSDAAFTATPTSFTLQNTNDLKEIFVTFQPDEKGTFQGTMTISSNAPQKQLTLSGIGFDNYFNVVEPTGLPYTVIVRQTNLDGLLQPGDELGVFDGSLCVGLNAPFTSDLVLSLDGNGDYVEIPDSPSLGLNGNQMTVEAWVKINSYSGDYRCIIGKIGWNNSSDWSYNLHIADNGTLHFNFVNTSGTSFPVNSPDALPLNAWHHVAATYNGSQIRLFVDGLQVATMAASGNIRQNSQVVKIGSWWSSDPNYFDGKLNEVRLWNYACSQSQIHASMNGALTGTESGLAGYWNFESGDATDLSQFGNDGTLAGNALISPEWIASANQSITAWKADPANGLPGFTAGHPMTFKLWTEINGFPTELSATPTFVVGNGNFGFGLFSVVDLEFGFAQISVEPEEIFVSLEEPASTQSVVTVTNSGDNPLQFETSFSDVSGEATGNSLLLDGSDDFVVIPHIYPNLDEVTVEAWIYPTSVSGTRFIISNGRDCCTPTGGFNLFLSGGSLAGQIWRSASPQLLSVSSANVIVANQWQHVAMTYNGKQVKLFRNGVEVAASAVNGQSSILNGSNNLHLGILAYLVPTYYEFVGNVDEVRIWNYALTESEIFYKKGTVLSGNETGLLGYWNFDDGTVTDLTVNGHDGALSGNAVTTGTNAPVAGWIEVSPTASVVAPGASAELTLFFNSTGLNDGLYGADLILSNNSPENSLITVPVTMNVTGNPQISSSVASVDFGQVVVNQTSGKSFLLKNIGTKDMIITGISISNGATTGFDYELPSKSFPLTLNPGQAAEVVVNFTPAIPGQVTDDLVVESNAGNFPLFTIPLTGEGITPPEIYLPQSAFSYTIPCNDEVTDVLKIKNLGQNTLQVTLTPGEDWLAVSPATASVAGGDSTEIAVTIATYDIFAGLHTATLAIATNDPGNPVAEVSYSVTITGDPAILCNDFINVGTAFVGDTLVGQLTVANSGCDVLNILSVNVQSQFPVFFINNPQFEIQPGEAGILGISFVPGATQQYSGIITINSNDPANAAVPVVISATGVQPPTLSVNPLSISATVQSGSSVQRNFVVKNTGGQVLNFTSSANGINPYMLKLDGNGDYINVVNAPDLNPASEITLEAWIYLYDNTNEFIIGKENSTEGKYRLLVNASNRFEFELNNQFVVTSSLIASKNQWYHLAATFDGSTMSIFINGNLDARQTFAPFTIQSNTDNLRIGRSYQFAYFNGLMDEIRVWNIARNQSEIQSAMNQALLGTEPELLLYFPFVNASGNIVTDASSYGHNGILYGNPVRQSSTVPFSDYLALTNGNGNLNANQQQSVNVGLNSTGFFAGTYQRQITVNSNAPSNPSAVVSVNLTVEGAGNVAADPAQVAFANTFIGLKDTFELVLENTGATAVPVSGIAFSSPVFSSLNQVNKVFPFSQKVLKLVFEPTLAQLYEGTLTISLGNSKSTQLTIPLSGLGVTPPIPVLSPTVADFGDVVVNHTGEVTITLSNAGSSALVVNSFSIPGSPLFSSNLQLPQTIPFGQQIQFDISFAPVNYDPVSAEMLIISNIGLISIPLSGTGVPPDHDLSVTSIITPENDCGLSNAEVLKISVKNFGVLPQSNFNVGFRLDNGAVVTETISGTLPSGQSLVYTFGQTLNLSVVKSYSLEVFTLLGNDQNTWNDTLTQTITNFPSVGPVSGLLPADSTFGVVEPVSFSWLPTPNATAYDLYLWRTSQPRPESPTVATITGTSFTYTQYLNKNYLYNWQIVARNQCSQSESAIQLFAFNVFSDLTVTQVTAPATASSGEYIDITFTVSNIGTGGTGIIPWKDDIYISTSPVFNPATAVKIASVNNKSALNQGQSYVNTASIKLADYLEGEFYVFVVTDANNIIQETNETNNTKGAENTMNVNLPPYPDLTVGNIQSLSGNIIPGQNVTVGWDVENIGDAPATGGWSQRVALIQGSQIQILGYVQNSETLDPDGIIAPSASFQVPNQIGFEGDIFIQVRLTPNPGLVEKPNGTENNTALSMAAVLLEKRLTLSVPQASMPENATYPLNCMIFRSGYLSQPLVVNLSASESGRITIPATVTIPANQAGAPFTISALNNSIIEGNINLVISADGSGFPLASTNLTIVDDEIPALSASFNLATADEGATLQLTVTRDLVTGNPLTVNLFTMKPNQITIPGTLVIPANEASATIDVPVVNNATPELTETVSVTASFTGYTSGSASVTILDDDLPQIQLTINPATVSEGGGTYAAWGTVTLDEPANGNVQVMISASPAGQLFFPAQITITNGQLQQQFNIGVVDNGILDGDRSVAITAAVYISSCGCGAPPETGGAVTQNITILDNDGPSLTVGSTPYLVNENVTNAGYLTITRNTLGGNEIPVTIQHNGADEIQIATSALIPEGATSVNVPFNTLDDGIEDGDQIVTVTVSSPDYSSGSCWVIVSDRNLPDYVARGLALSQNAILINDPVDISFYVVNEGFSLGSDGVEVKIYRSDDATIGTGDVLLSTQYTVNVLNIGDSAEINLTYTPFDKVGNFYIIANVNANGGKNELLNINNTTQAVPLAILPDYTASASVAGDVFNGTTPITITGVTETVVKSPAPNKPVDVYIVVNGAKRIVNAVSDNNGEFSVNFYPLNGEAGSYFIGACYPGQNSSEPQDEFTILGARTNVNDYITWNMWLNETRQFFLEIKNNSPLDLSNVRVEVLSGPPGCQVTFTPIAALPGDAFATLSYTVHATEVTTGNLYQEVKLQLVSDEGTRYRFSAWFFSQATMGNLKLEPVSLNKAMVRGITNYAEFTVRNNGLDSTGVISIMLPQNNWMSLAGSSNTIASLDPGETAVVTLRLTPGEDLQLNNPITGQIALSGTHSNSVALPFSFEPVSTETGDLLVDVVDEYTYNTEAAPHLEGATVVLTHPYTGQIIAQGVSDVNGHFLAEGINEGYYILRVTAPQHGSYQNTIYIEKGITNTQVTFLAFQAITYSWEVVPTMIEDEYEINLVVVFETNVPAPVVVMSMPDTMPQLNLGEVYPFLLILTNHGLITAEDVEVTFPQDDEYEFIANVNMLNILPQSSVQIPVIMQRRAPTSAPGKSSNCSDFTIASYKFQCGPDNQMRIVQDQVYYEGRYCGGSGGSGTGGDWGWCYDCGGYGPGYGPGGGTGPVFPFEIPTAPYQQSNVGCDPCLADFLNALWDCSPIPNIGIGKGMEYGGGTSGFSKLVDLGKKLAPWKKVFDKLKCAWNIGWSLGCKINQALGNAPIAAGNAPPEVIQAQEDLFMVDKGFTATENLIHEVYDNEIMIERVDFPIFNDSVNYNIETLSPIDNLRLNDLLNAFNQSDIPQDEITGFVSRWNTSLEAYDAGVYSPTPDYPNIIDTLLIYNYSLTYDTAFNYALERGFGSIEEMYNWAYEIVEGYTEETSSSVCATVTVQFSQQLTMTREAFEGTLTIFNGHETDAMQNILLDLEIKDEDGILKNDLFQINTQALNQITGIDGNGELNAQTEGTAVIMFIPERGAAPDVPKYYSFGGTLSYLDPFTGEMFEQPLFPVTLQVNPSPNLYIDYFMQRDILGDDALTEPIEPMVPAELAVMIDNQGAGTAYSVKIESAQPEIIENEKGLLIDFEIVGSNLGGKPKQLGLMDVNFGDIPGGDIAVGQWWFTSTLLGHFISYEVTVNHLNSFGNPELSLVSDVQLHELIKSVSVYGVHYDSINDFLVNDVPDTDDIPDALYYSNGIVAQVVEADSSETDGQVSLNDLEIELLVTPSVDGWNYTRLDDPGNGFFRIVSCTREDGQEIPLDNIWLTYVTIPDGGEPLYENKLHFLDYFDEQSPMSYTVIFEAIDQNFPEVVAFAGVPTGVTDTPVTDVEVIFNKPIDPATYDYQDMTLKNQGGTNLMDSTVVVTQLNDTTFNVNISAKTAANGFYVMTVQAAGIADLIGNYGQTGKQVSWIQAISTPAIDHFFGLPEDGEPTDTLLVLFNMPINETTFTTNQLVLTGPDGNTIPTSSLVITSESFNNVLFKISGLLALTSGDGDYDLTFKVTEIQGETGLAGLLDQTVEWTVCQIPLPVADAGEDDSVCIGDAYQLEGSAQNAGSLVWTSTGTGTFDNNQVLNPVYTPSLADISMGSVEITLTAQPLNACAAAVSSSILLTIKNAVEADAGDDATICQNTTYQLFGTVSHAQSYYWITSGNGTFNPAGSLTPVYTPGTVDIAAGEAMLSLVAEPQSPCTLPDTASMNLVVQKLPSAYAGPNQNVCEDNQVQLQGTAQNYSSVYWYGGQGTMSDRTILNPVYTFSAEDIERGYVNFLLTVEAQSPCYTKAYSVTRVNVKKAPVANAGLNTTICENQTLQLSGSVQFQSAFAWSTSGDGTFSQTGSLSPVYTPGSTDILAGAVQITLTAQPVSPCQLPDVSSLTLTILPLPSAIVGDDALICENQTFQLAGSVQNNASFYWQTSGDGTFNPINSLTPVYTPGPLDISEGGADLTLTATPVAPCLVSDVSTISLEIQGLPVADAGDNAEVCENQTIQLSGMVENAGTYFWQTSGDGIFDDENILNPVYTPGTGDVAATFSELSLTAEPIAPCALSDISTMMVTISHLPNASAGSDATVCYGEPAALAGNVENTESSLWETSGDGTFIDSGSLSTMYHPGYADLQNGQAIVTLNALPVSPCDLSATDDLIITVNHCQNLTIPAGWSGISGFVQPADASLENIFSNVMDDLIILQTETGMFWPGQNVNTLGDWSRSEGYKIKAENEIQLGFAGQWSGNNDLPLNADWNLIPVLSSCPVNVADLFDGIGVTIVKEVAGWRVYWPDQGINTLGLVDPGKAYFVRMPGNASITFPDCEAGKYKSGQPEIPERFVYSSAKENTDFTPFTHTIAFAEGFSFEPGTQILAYDQQGNCCGIVEWQSHRTALTIVGDDPFTTVKDGATEGEPLTFVMISPDGFEQTMEVFWDENLPNSDGKFHNHGLSVMKEASLSAHYDFTGSDEITIFPNPAKEFVVIASKCGTEMTIQFLNQIGVNCLETTTSESIMKIDVSYLVKGVYMVIITCENETVVKKLVVE